MIFFAAFRPRKSSQVASAICTLCFFFSGFCSDFSYFHLVFAKSRQATKTTTGCDISPKCLEEMFQPSKLLQKIVETEAYAAALQADSIFFPVKISGIFGSMGFRDFRDFGSDFVVRAGGELTSCCF